MGSQAVQGGGGTTASAAYTDPAASPGRPSASCYPPASTSGRRRAARRPTRALRPGRQGPRAPSQSFTDFPEPQHRRDHHPPGTPSAFQDRTAYQAVIQDPAVYLGTTSPSQGLLGALYDVRGLLDRVDTRSGSNVYAVPEDPGQLGSAGDRNGSSWGPIRSPRSPCTIADNQQQNNPRCPTWKPPSSPEDALLDGRGRGRSRGALRPWPASRRSISRLLFFTGLGGPARGASCWASSTSAPPSARPTPATCRLKDTTAQMPTLVVPPDKNLGSLA